MFFSDVSVYLKIFIQKVIFSGETWSELYQSGYDQSLNAFFFLLFTIPLTVQILHSYEYDDGTAPLLFLVL